MKILILNWKDTKNPTSGGAEVLTHELAKGWVAMGNEVTMIVSAFAGCHSDEVFDGIRIIRLGHSDVRSGIGSVHYLAARRYLQEFKGKIDVVVDEVHGFPFFTPFYVHEPVVPLICEVADTIWATMFGPIVGLLGKIIESLYIRVIYKNAHWLTISPSTHDDLLHMGVKNENITILPMGITVPDKIKIKPKSKKPTIIFVGRLVASKGIEDTLNALKIVKAKLPDVQLWIIGRGDVTYEEHLRSVSKDLNLTQNVTFYGFVSASEKFSLMSQAHVLVAPSVKEGWGLIVPEAGLVGTPSVVYPTHGLRDVVEDGKTGHICREQSPESLASGILQLFGDNKKYAHIREAVMKKSKSYSWAHTVRVGYYELLKLYEK